MIQHYRSNAARAGMTLVELMVATMLSTMLLAALVGVLGGIAKQSKLMDAYDQPVWPSPFCNLLRRDLLAADAIWKESDVIWIQTDVQAYRSAQQDETLGMRPIGYQCAKLRNGQSVLTRTDAGMSSVLAIGPQRIVLERLDKTGSPQPLPPTAGPVPEQVRVWVWEDESQPPVLLRDLVLR